MRNAVCNSVSNSVRNIVPTRPDPTRPDLFLLLPVVVQLNQVQIVEYVTAREATGLDLEASQ